MKKFLAFIQKHRTLVLLFSIFGVALFFRLLLLGTLPFDFHEDEVLSGYVGRFILQNGVDVYGNPWPILYFNKFGDYYIMFPFYLSGLGTYLFGVNEFGVRFAGALLGALAVFPVYIFSKWTFKNTTIALLSAFFLALLPWSIVLSRTTVEGLMGSTVFISAIVLLLYAMRSKKLVAFILAGALIGFTYLFYHPFRVYAPLVFLPLPFLFPELRKQKKLLIATVLFCVLFFGLTAYIGTTPWGKGRFVQTSIFSELSGVSIRVQEQIYNEPSIWMARMFSNKIVGYSREFLTQYFQFFSPVVLFMRGGISPRFAVPDSGLLYLAYGIGLIAALLPLKNKIPLKIDKSYLLYLLYLLLLAPVPAAMTVLDSPNIHRAAFFMLPLCMFAAYGIYKLKDVRVGKFSVLYGVFFLLAIELVYFVHQYAIHSDLLTSIYRNDGQKQAVQYVAAHKNEYKKIYLPMDGTFPLYYLFYTNDFQKKYAKEIGFNIRLKHVDNVYFVEDDCYSKRSNEDPALHSPDTLIVERGTCTPSQEFEQIATLHGRNPLMPFKILVPKLPAKTTQ